MIVCLTNCISRPTWLSLANVIALLDREVTLLMGGTVLVPCAFNSAALHNGVALEPGWTDAMRLVIIHLTNCSVTTRCGQTRINTLL